MKLARLALISLPLLLAAGCQKTQLPSSIERSPSTTDRPSALGAPSVSVHTFSKKWTDKDLEGCEFSLTFPELTRPSTWNDESDTNDAILDQANLELLRAYGLASATGTVALNPELVAAEFIDLCKSDLEDITRELGQEAIANLYYVNDSSFSVQLLTPTYVSFSIDTYEYTGGAHGNPGIQGITIDLKTGKKLTLGDVIKNDQLQSIMKYAYADILKGYEDALYEEAREEITTIVNDTSAMTPEQQKEKFGFAENFFLTGDGLMLFWNVYEITPYVAGQQMVFIPWSKLENKLNIKPL